MSVRNSKIFEIELNEMKNDRTSQKFSNQNGKNISAR